MNDGPPHPISERTVIVTQEELDALLDAYFDVEPEAQEAIDLDDDFSPGMC